MKIKKENLISICCIFLVSIISSFLVFYKGFNNGDDRIFHISNIYDIYKTLKEGNALNSISCYQSGGLGTATRLFYSPLTHLYFGIGIYLLSYLNLAFIPSFKILFVFATFNAGIFMHKFALDLTNNNKKIALIGAIIYIVYPYRLFDSFCRWALAESISFVFIPLFFDGLYGIATLKKNKIKEGPFFKTIIGGALLTFTHNITVLYAGCFGVLLLVFYSRKIITNLKNKRFLIYTLASVILLSGIISHYVLTVYELINTGLYNVSDSDQMASSIASVIKRTGEQWNYSGFLNFKWLQGRYPDDCSNMQIFLPLGLFCLGIALFFLLSYTFKKKFNKSWIGQLIGIILLYLSVSFYSIRWFSIACVTVFLLLYFSISLISKISISFTKEKCIFTKPIFYWSILTISICYFLMVNKEIWSYIPQLFLNIQFPWRLWTFVQLGVTVIFILIGTNFNKSKFISISLITVSSLLVYFSQPLWEKSLLYKYNDSNSSYYISAVDDSYLNRSEINGWNKEYLPKIFYDSSFSSEYSNSLYNLISTTFKTSRYSQNNIYTISPVFLNGGGNISVENQIGGYWNITISADSESLIQLPIIYYPGYEISYEDNNGSIILQAMNIDGLVGFKINSGDYSICIKYKGTKLNRITKVISIACSTLTLSFVIYSIVRKSRKIDYSVEL